MTRIALFLVLLTGLAACETFEGVGQDVQQGGQAISNTAQDVDEDI